MNRRLDDFGGKLDFDQLPAVNGRFGRTFSGGAGQAGGSRGTVQELLIGVVVDYSISGKGNTKTGTISWEK